MIRFYAPDIQECLRLPIEEARHCIRVLRHKTGDIIEVGDGKGSIYECRIVAITKDDVSLEIITSIECLKPWKGTISVAVAPPKNVERIEWMVEKITEIGVDSIIPVRCARSERKDLRIDRIEKIVISSMKQALQPSVPLLHSMLSFSDLMIMTRDYDGKYIAFCGEDSDKKELADVINTESNCVILIGPEGDFTENEVATAKQYGYVPVALGSSRLRTETAAIVAADTFHIVQSLRKNNSDN